MAERVGDGEQQAVRGRERRREAASGHEAGDDVGQARDLGRRDDDRVVVDAKVAEAQDAGMSGDLLAGRRDRARIRGVDAADLHEPDLAVGVDPARELADVLADHVIEDLELREGGIAGAVK